LRDRPRSAFANGAIGAVGSVGGPGLLAAPGRIGRVRTSRRAVRHLRLAPPVFLALLRTVDGVLLLAAGALAERIAGAGGGWVPENPRLLAGVVGAGLALAALNRAGAYGIGTLRRPAAQFGRLGAALLLACAGMLACVRLLHADAAWPLVWTGCAAAMLVPARLAVLAGLRRPAFAGLLARRIAVVGSAGPQLVEALQGEPAAPIHLVGVYDDGHGSAPPGPVAGSVQDLLLRSRRERIDAVVLALPLDDSARINAVLLQLRSAVVDIFLAPDMGRMGLAGARLTSRIGCPVFQLAEPPLEDWQSVQKAIFDRLFAALLLGLLAPLLLAAALAVRLETPGPALFRQRRLGFNNVAFTVLKFRTMHHHLADPGADRQTMRDDPRVTRVGAWLRRLGIDELPQLLNVLRGEMSLVGPRPHALNTRAGQHRLEAVVAEYALRHRVKPGITGWAQVNGCRGPIATAEQIRRRVEHDLHYIENWSLALDAKILLMTLLNEIGAPHAF